LWMAVGIWQVDRDCSQVCCWSPVWCSALLGQNPSVSDAAPGQPLPSVIFHTQHGPGLPSSGAQRNSDDAVHQAANTRPKLRAALPARPAPSSRPRSHAPSGKSSVRVILPPGGQASPQRMILASPWDYGSSRPRQPEGLPGNSTGMPALVSAFLRCKVQHHKGPLAQLQPFFIMVSSWFHHGFVTVSLRFRYGSSWIQIDLKN